jgi:hypothetical protein
MIKSEILDMDIAQAESEQRVFAARLDEESTALKPTHPYRNTHLRALDEKKSTAEEFIKRILLPYSQAICKHFCNRLLTKLPRELRDIIYEHTVAPDYIYVGPQYLQHSERPCEIDRDAHYWDADYTGGVVSAELVQTWYRITLFYFWDRARNSEVINEFMTFDRWGRGIKPHEHISRVRFDLGDNKFYSRAPPPGVVCMPPTYSDILTGPLKSFRQFHFPQRVMFVIRIHTMGSLVAGCFTDAALLSLLEAVLAELEALKLAGHRFTVQWSEIRNLEFSSNNCVLSADAWKEDIDKVREQR